MEAEKKPLAELEEVFGMGHGVITSDEFSDINNSHRIVTQSR